MDGAEKGVPRAPGMKYKHYSPKAKVILVEGDLDLELMAEHGTSGRIGVLTTKKWHMPKTDDASLSCEEIKSKVANGTSSTDRIRILETQDVEHQPNATIEVSSTLPTFVPSAQLTRLSGRYDSHGQDLNVWTIPLGSDAGYIARGLFSALRELDHKNVDAILVEGISGSEGDTSAAVMNRLRKAAELQIKR